MSSHLINQREACQRLGISRYILARLVSSGRLPEPVKLSPRRLGYRVDALDALARGTSLDAAAGR